MARAAQVREPKPEDQDNANAAEDQDNVADAPAEGSDSPVLDLTDAAVKRLIKTAKARGYVTLDELNSVMPSEEVTSDQIEDIYSMLADMGITVVESEEETENVVAKVEGEESTETAVIKVEAAKVPTDRTDDPVRMYLREMGQVELLSREGEIAIAKRIEAGREAMIAGLVRKPADLPGHHHLARRTERSKDSAARHHRS